MTASPSLPITEEAKDRLFFQTLVSNLELEGEKLAEHIIADTFPASLPWNTMNLHEIIQKVGELDKFFLLLTGNDKLREKYKFTVEDWMDYHYEKAYERLKVCFSQGNDAINMGNFIGNFPMLDDDLSPQEITLEKSQKLVNQLEYLLFFNLLYHPQNAPLFFQAGADINAKNWYGDQGFINYNLHPPTYPVCWGWGPDDGKGTITPLMFAARCGFYELAQYLIEHGAEVNAIVRDTGYTAIKLAAENNHLEIVQYLIEHDATVNGIDNVETTALIWAAQKGHLPIVQYLIEHGGANINHADRLKKTALTYAKENKFLAIEQYLINHGAHQDSACCVIQ